MVDVWTPGFSALCGPWEWRCQDWESRCSGNQHTDSEPASGNEGEDKANSCHEELIPSGMLLSDFLPCSCLHHRPLKENDIQQQSLRMVEQTLFWTFAVGAGTLQGDFTVGERLESALRHSHSFISPEFHQSCFKRTLTSLVFHIHLKYFMIPAYFKLVCAFIELFYFILRA